MPKRGGATGACNSPARVMEVAAESADQQAEKPMTPRPTAATITREHPSYSEVTSAESFAVLPKSPLLNKGAIPADWLRATVPKLKLVNQLRLPSQQIALGAFIDISGAFDNTSYEAIHIALINKGVSPLITSWILVMLKSRIITADLGEQKTSIIATRGCPQWGVLSSLLWTLVIDKGYADDLVICVSGCHEPTISERMQYALDTKTRWCEIEMGMGRAVPI
ncbi:hypothetical protein ACLKA6_008508 [Drosophila palustris]